MAITMPPILNVLLCLGLVPTILASLDDVCDVDLAATGGSLLQLPKHSPISLVTREKLALAAGIRRAPAPAVTRDQGMSHSCMPLPASALLKRISSGKVRDRHRVSEVPPSVIHDVVGWDGVLQISLERAGERASSSSNQLREVGISATHLPATDASCTPQHVLEEACNEHCSPEEAAIAHSHKRALELAALRDIPWTAIFEDDAVPTLPEGISADAWEEDFRNIWSRVPETAKIVRLSWCVPNLDDQWSLQWEHPEVGQGKMKLQQFGLQNPQMGAWNSVGLCTTAYMVHKDIVQTMLGIFPCNCPLDACLGWKFFASTDVNGVPYFDQLYNLDIEGSAELSSSIDPSGWWMKWYGVVRQAREQMASTVVGRAGFNYDA